MAKHLHHAGKIVVCEAAAEAGIRLREHLCGLKAFGFADDDVFDVRCDDSGRALAIDVIVAAGLESFHEGALAAVTESDDGQSGILGVGANHARDVECAHFSHVG